MHLFLLTIVDEMRIGLKCYFQADSDKYRVVI